MLKNMTDVLHNKWDLLEEETKAEILQYARDNGPWEAAARYKDEVGMGLQGLYLRLKKTVNFNRRGPSPSTPDDAELGEEEKVFLQRIKDGTVGLEEASRKVAGMVFEKMLRNPNDVKFDAFFKTKLLELKQSEQADKNNQAMMMINMMFNGRLPPKSCPRCGHVLYETPVVINKPDGTQLLGEGDDD